MAMAMVMVMIIHMIQKMIDIHTHFMYGVDDGSKNLKMTEELLSLSNSQGVKTVFLTPHVRSELSEKQLNEFSKKFNEISEDEVGVLLRLLVASKPGAVVLELGTGTGMGLDWLGSSRV